MRKNDVKYIYITPVYNVLLKLGDPTCVGFMAKNEFEIVSKCRLMLKSISRIKIGVHVLNNGKVNVC
jgi:UDP-N-acetylglucosamine pyrophosphorylase